MSWIPKKGKRERVLIALSLGSRKCKECDSWSLTLKDKSLTEVNCKHCNGSWVIADDGYSLERVDYTNVKPHYLEMD
tara:strand:- start:972 stop:1202 length:231 start_codon:yes stop_codon:yes gene_type:complete